MNKKALLGILLAVMLPIGSYLIVKQFTDNNELVPRRLYYDTVLTTVKDGKESTDTVWHKVKDFQLINQLGNTASLSQLGGKVIVADFFFTHCGSICPMLTKNMKKLQSALKMKDDKRLIDTTFVHFLSFSVDPERDSAPQLKKFADRYGINHDTWWMLTGPKHTIYDFAMNEVRLGVPDSTSVDTNFIHSPYFVLLDRDRVVRGYYNGLDSVALGRLSEDIVFLMLEKDKKKRRKLF